jgi:hypothetical protein
MAVNRMWEVMNSCVTMHNMIVESEHTSLVKDDHPYDCQGSLDKVDHQLRADFRAFLSIHHEIHDELVHQQLQDDLVEHLWTRIGNAA